MLVCTTKKFQGATKAVTHECQDYPTCDGAYDLSWERSAVETGAGHSAKAVERFGWLEEEQVERSMVWLEGGIQSVARGTSGSVIGSSVRGVSMGSRRYPNARAVDAAKQALWL